MFGALLLVITFAFFAQTVGGFYDTKVPQIQFTVQNVKTALESKGFKVEMLALSKLKANYSNKKVVIALTSNKTVTSLMTTAGGALPTGLGEQAYALRTTMLLPKNQTKLSHNLRKEIIT